MWRIAFAGLIALPLVGRGQSGEIPGRDLLNFPLGLAAESAALGTQFGTGFWNPATVILPDGSRWRLSAAAMSSSADIGVSGQLGAVAGVWRGTTIGLSVARAAVADLLRTDADPLSLGNEIPYSTTVVSAVAARRLAPRLVGGLAIRVRTGQLDNVTRTATCVDFGILAEHLTSRDVRLAGATFLISPGSSNRERSTFLFGVDARLAGADSARTMRAGYALVETSGLSAEHYLFAAARWGRWEARGGPVRTDIYGGSNVRLRLGVAVRHVGYAMGVSREESASGLAPTYHFSLSSVLK